MIGAPSFHEGEEVVLFLGARPPAIPYLLGLGQGVYRVARDSRTGAARVVTPALVASRGESVKVQRGDPSRRSITVDEFRAEVQQALGRSSVPREGSRSRRIGG